MKWNTIHEKFINDAIKQAKLAYKKGEAPIGCVIVHEGNIIARGHNLRQTKNDVTLHAEMIALRKACKKMKSWRLSDCDLYVTLEPCYMCAGAIIQARVRHVYFGALDPKGGAVVSKNTLFSLSHNHHVEATHILSEECGDLLRSFFRALRTNKPSNPL